MYFKRNLSSQLSAWQRSSNKKPLLLKGIRQVGKTTLVNEWGSTKFDHVAYFDLCSKNNWIDIFNPDFEPDIVIEKLASIKGIRIDSTSTLIVLDNLDRCPNALEYFSKFNSLIKKHCVIGISSYFEFLSKNFHDNYFENICIKTLYPLTFKEYLEKTSQIGKASYSHYVNRDHIKSIKKKFFTILQDKFQDYLVSGGLPEPAKIYHRTKSKSATYQVQKNIIACIESDFLNFNSGVLPKRTYEVWRNVLCNNHNGKFKFSSIDSNSRIREYGQSVNWLKMAGLIYEIKADKNVRYIPADVGFSGTKNETGIISHNRNIEYIYALSCLTRKYPIVKIVGDIIHVENKSNRIPVACMSNRGIRKYVGSKSAELLVHLKMSHSKLTQDVLQLPVFYVDEVSKFNRTALSQLHTNYFPEKRPADFY